MKTLLAIGLTAVLGGTWALADDFLPGNALPLSSILEKIEQAGIGPVVEASFDDGVWEIETFRGQKSVELQVSPSDGRILGEVPDSVHFRPNANSLTAANIAKSLESEGFKPVLELDWNGVQWEAEAIRGGSKRELRIDAASGKIVSDRLDD